MTRVWLLRHAESADPTVFHGAESDIGLSERGQRQAQRLAPILAACKPSAIIASAMRRARETAAPTAAACGLPLQLEPLLHERKVGALCGLPIEASESIWHATRSRWLAGDTGYAPDGAESFDAIRDRVLPVWNRLTSTYVGRTLVVVAHGVVCKVLLLSIIDGWSHADWLRIGFVHNVALHELAGSAPSPYPLPLRGGAGRGRWRLLRYNELPEPLRETDVHS